MNIVFKRISAFIFDMLLITFLTMAVSGLSYLNPYKYDYEEATTNYQNSYSELLNDLENIDVDSMLDKMSLPYMNTLKYGVFTDIYYLVFCFLYFVIFVYFNNGQTLGKKLFKIKVIGKNEKRASLVQLTLRNLIYGSNLYMGINLFLIIKVILIFSLNRAIPFYYSMIFLTYSQIIIEIISVGCLFKKKERSLSDLISDTKVIDLK